MRSRFSSLFVLLILGACDPAPIDMDAWVDDLDGGPDAGSPDASPLDAGSPDAGPPPGDPFEAAPDVAPWSAAELAELASVIDGALDDPSVAGTTSSVLVVDLETGQELYARSPDLPLKPASNTKLFTTAAALSLLGPDHRLPIRALTSGSLDASTGRLTGDLHFFARHELTTSTDFHEAADHPVRQLARRLAEAGLTQVTGEVVLHGEVLWDGYRFGSYSAEAHRAAYAAGLDRALAGEGIVAPSVRTASDFDPPADARELARWDAVPLSVMSYPINTISHNEMADVLLRHLGLDQAGESSYTAGASVVMGWLAERMDTTGMALNDGSGLSHDNRVTARQIVSLIDGMLQSEVGLPWTRTFSVAGVRGTLAGRMTGPDTLGRFLGKSGTLRDTIATSGVLHHRYDGRRYAISALLNQVTNASAARVAQNRIVEAVARSRSGLTRLDAPVLESVRGEGTGSSVSIAWDAVEGADGYLVWLSARPGLFERSRARFVRTTRFSAGELEPGAVYVRVQAIGEAGGGTPSDVYAASVGRSASSVLLVDGDDRWQAQPTVENVLGGGHDFLVRHAEVLEDIAGDRGVASAFDSATNEAVATGSVDLRRYPIVVWSAGEEALADTSFDLDEQARVEAFLGAGGHLFVSGAEIGWDLVSQGTTEDRRFFEEVLRASFVGDDAGTVSSESVATTGPCAGLGEINFYAPSGIVVSFPDQLAPSNGSEPCASYVGGLGGTAALTYDGAYRLVHLGFPFEAIPGRRERGALMGAALTFFRAL